MNTKHTAGQWRIYDTCLPARGIIEIQANGKVIANVKRLVSGKCYAASQCPEAEANAKLIAAAPELLEALKDCIDFLQSEGYNSETFKPLVKALAAQEKAEG